VNVTADELVSEAERAYAYGDGEAVDRIERDAKSRTSRPPTNGNGNRFEQ
jgi:hypothetical protein